MSEVSGSGGNVLLAAIRGAAKLRPFHKPARTALQMLRSADLVPRHVEGKVNGRKIVLDLNEMVDQKVALFSAFDQRGLGLIKRVMKAIDCRTWNGEGAPIVGDIRSATAADTWIVVGWFTPDYRSLAERLSRSLDVVKAPYHLLAKSPGADWSANTRRKAGVLLEAMEFYPNKTIVLMDVDAEALGDISPIADIASDVALFVRPKFSWHGRANLQLSARVVVLRPTPGARMLAEAWKAECQNSRMTDEPLLGIAWSRCPGVTLTPLAASYAARERDVAPADAMLVHDSARDVSLVAFKPMKLLKRWMRENRAQRTASRPLQTRQ